MTSNDAAEPLTRIHQQVNEARAGRNPRVIARLFSGWAVFGERQFVRGYTLLLPDPVVAVNTRPGDGGGVDPLAS